MLEEKINTFDSNCKQINYQEEIKEMKNQIKNMVSIIETVISIKTK